MSALQVGDGPRGRGQRPTEIRAIWHSSSLRPKVSYGLRITQSRCEPFVCGVEKKVLEELPGNCTENWAIIGILPYKLCNPDLIIAQKGRGPCE